jgi:hypothetical protein
MKRVIVLLALAVAGVAAASGIVFAGAANAADEAPYEVWAMDQSDSTPGGGGRVYYQ